MTSGVQRVWGVRDDAEGVEMPGSVWAGNTAADRAANATNATAQTIRERLERVHTGLVLHFRELPLSRFTVKIRTPSLLEK
ncbi:hypothetical protein GCM10011507_21760 [Edaphobacter acidisoli]|uniref:Uncharacterized protein n=1 Tax=Edaphobacter acidisoli TaxID=2040573 RepID=A0A916W6E0_9BACT|nr:hypothetical protein GCM10011507_21760 [Edaphobacter acidisoli]